MKTIIELEKSSQISATEPDWNREKLRRWWDPSRQLLKSIREYQKWKARGGIIGRFLSACNVIQHRFWSVITAADIPLNCQLGGGLLLTHPNGVVIHPDASIGANCLILQQVTIVKDVKIGGHVDIGAGAKIIRAVSIGDHAKIGANAVVICDVPAGATAVGIPAKIINSKNSECNSV
ncbi:MULTISPECIES: serine O-acetyltransferase [unclassified Coleofasciculus]|uniref:serine O-acetyltransferase n=1 Tax=unclassified Coleofasciculus TaxID=2692782 RepID=UPI00188274D9|nr:MULTISPECIES: serine acetyltransferase [unclassified Coleofasciculus]MBE9125779.1 serine acetyltransferase [Coleofasciculus sp. LEGE 07081]MBE9148452.1 serine acetyltransferase [Coleofasciculus sp. LEGE 07092]